MIKVLRIKNTCVIKRALKCKLSSWEENLNKIRRFNICIFLFYINIKNDYINIKKQLRVIQIARRKKESRYINASLHSQLIDIVNYLQPLLYKIIRNKSFLSVRSFKYYKRLRLIWQRFVSSWLDIGTALLYIIIVSLSWHKEMTFLSAAKYCRGCNRLSRSLSKSAERTSFCDARDERDTEPDRLGQRLMFIRV